MPELREHCKNHPILEADGRCASCWGFFCDACLDDIGEHRYCETCAPAIQAKRDEARLKSKETKRQLDLRMLMYVLVLMLGVVIGGSLIMFNGGLDQFFATYVPNYQAFNRPKSLGNNLDAFQMTETKHFKIYFHDAAMADRITQSVEERFAAIMSEFLIFENDVMGRGKFNILIVSDDAEFTKIFPDALPGRVAMTDYETKTIVVVTANETGDPLINLTHEMAHAIFFERMGGGTEIPDWIHEGLSSYIESLYNSSQVDLRWATFGANITQTGGQSLTTLAAPQTNGPEEVSRFYAQSHSIVRYLIDNYGMLKLMKLGVKLQAGKDIDTSLSEVYAPDITSLGDLETKWLVSLRT